MKGVIRNDQVAGKSMDPVTTHVSVESIRRNDPNTSGTAAKTNEVTGHLVNKGCGAGRDSAGKAERLDQVDM